MRQTTTEAANRYDLPYSTAISVTYSRSDRRLRPSFVGFCCDPHIFFFPLASSGHQYKKHHSHGLVYVNLEGQSI